MRGEQLKAARAMLGWSAMDLAQRTGISYATIQRLDSTSGALPGRFATIDAIRSALEAAGIQFLDEGKVAAGPGVALRLNTEELGD